MLAGRRWRGAARAAAEEGAEARLARAIVRQPRPRLDAPHLGGGVAPQRLITDVEHLALAAGACGDAAAHAVCEAAVHSGSDAPRLDATAQKPRQRRRLRRVGRDRCRGLAMGPHDLRVGKDVEQRVERPGVLRALQEHARRRATLRRRGCRQRVNEHAQRLGVHGVRGARVAAGGAPVVQPAGVFLAERGGGNVQRQQQREVEERVVLRQRIPSDPSDYALLGVDECVAEAHREARHALAQPHGGRRRWRQRRGRRHLPLAQPAYTARRLVEREAALQQRRSGARQPANHQRPQGQRGRLGMRARVRDDAEAVLRKRDRRRAVDEAAERGGIVAAVRGEFLQVRAEAGLGGAEVVESRVAPRVFDDVVRVERREPRIHELKQRQREREDVGGPGEREAR